MNPLDLNSDCLSILYVDDEPGLLELGKIFLELNPNIAVDTAIGPKDALLMIMEKEYNVIVSDYQMPDMDGIQFLKNLRHNELTIPFIIFTGKGREDVAIEALNNGADFYLQKGGDPRSQFAELLNMIKHAAGKMISEKEILASKNLLEATIDSIPDIIGILNTECDVVCYNQAGYDYLGKKPFEVIGKKCHIAHNQIQNCILCELNEAKNKKELIEFEKYDVSSSTHLDCRINPVVNDQNEVNFLVEIIRDVTEKKKAEFKLIESEEKYRNLVDNSGQGIVVMSNGTIVFSNRKAAEIVGHDVQNIEGFDYLDFIHPDDKDLVGQRYNRRMKGESLPNRYSFRLLHKDGSARWVEMNTQKINWMGSEASLIFFTDVTEKLRMECLWENMIRVVTDLLNEADILSVLNSITSLCERNDSDIRSTILLYDENKKMLYLGAAPKLPEEYHLMIANGIPVGANMGSCGAAAYHKTRVVVRDVQKDPRCAGMGAFLEVARTHEMNSCYSQPILNSNGDLLGAITNYGRHIGTPGSEMIILLEQTAKIAALAIEKFSQNKFSLNQKCA